MQHSKNCITFAGLLGDIGYRIWDIGYRVSGIGYRVSGIGRCAIGRPEGLLGIGYWISGIGYRILDEVNDTLYILRKYISNYE